MAKSRVVLLSAALWSILWKEMIAVVEGTSVVVIALNALSLDLHKFHMRTDLLTVLNWIINPAIRPTQLIRWKLLNLVAQSSRNFKKSTATTLWQRVIPQMLLPAVWIYCMTARTVLICGSMVHLFCVAPIRGCPFRNSKIRPWKWCMWLVPSPHDDAAMLNIATPPEQTWYTTSSWDTSNSMRHVVISRFWPFSRNSSGFAQKINYFHTTQTGVIKVIV